MAGVLTGMLVDWTYAASIGFDVAAGVFLDGDTERRVRANPGDYVYVPPFASHREENPDPDEDAVVVIARTTQQAIVVNLPSLRAGAEDAWHRSS